MPPTKHARKGSGALKHGLDTPTKKSPTGAGTGTGKRGKASGGGKAAHRVKSQSKMVETRSSNGASRTISEPVRQVLAKTLPSTVWVIVDKYDEAFSTPIQNFNAFGLLGEMILLLPASLFSIYLLPFVLLGAFFCAPGFRFFTEALAGCLLTLATTTLLKRLFRRLRPGDRVLILRRFNLRSYEHNFSLPSGDSAQSALFCTLMFLNYGSVLPLCMVPATMLARVYFGAHWIGDTVVGAAIGVAWAVILHVVTPALFGCSSSVAALAIIPPLLSAWGAAMCAV